MVVVSIVDVVSMVLFQRILICLVGCMLWWVYRLNAFGFHMHLLLVHIVIA